MKVLSASQMREVDRLTTERHGVPSKMLMESAALRVVETVESEFGSVASKHILVICGKGNNGGDGAAAARLLHAKKAHVSLFLLGKANDARGDARANFDAARAIAEGAQSFKFVEIENAAELRASAGSQPFDLAIDAIFGTGLTRPASGIFKDAIELLNSLYGIPVISVDIPSGAASDSFDLIGPTVRARLTVTFTAPKPANVLPPASEYNGTLTVVSIGSPDELLESSGSRLNLVDRSMVQRWLRQSRRATDANKGDVGKVLVIAGSRGKAGAACLAGEAALRAGCGLVTVATPMSTQPVVASKLIPECMTEPLPETSAGTVSQEAADIALAAANERDVVAIGPGIGATEESTRNFVRSLVSRRHRPMVIDADGLNSLAPWDGDLAGSPELPLILTPHPGEMARLIGESVANVIKNRIDVVRAFAVTHGVILVLKGSRTLVGAPHGEVYVNPTGNAGMATGGTGDVLTGIIAGLLAQRPDSPLDATIAAVYLHGLAGDIAARRMGIRAMLATDITARLSDAFLEAGGEQERL